MTAPTDTPWHSRPIDEVLSVTGSHAAGLDHDEAAARLAQTGPNRIEEQRPRGWLARLAAQFGDFMILVLLAAALVSGFIGDLADTLVILIIVLLNAVIGMVQEYRAERAIAALRQLAAPQAIALRGGEPVTLPAAGLVPGDVVLLEAGNIVPADLRLIETAGLRTQEAALTGESSAVSKSADAGPPAAAPLGERTTMAYKGTLIVHGRGRGVVVATGMRTELGRIAGLLQDTLESRTPLQQRLARFGHALALVVLSICVVVFAAGVWRGEPVLLMLLTAISLAVAAIPEALPAVVTITLALGARQMARHAALIRKLPAVETLGSVTFICSDKTGTLTENRMQAEALAIAGETGSPPGRWPGDPAWQELLRAMALNNDSRRLDDGQLTGDPTEIALLEAAQDAGFTPAQAMRWPRIAELPFDPDRRRMTTLHRPAAPAPLTAYVKGSPETVLERCTSEAGATGPRPLDRAARLAEAAALAARGLRVLAFARREFDVTPVLETDPIERDLVFLGFAGLLDPPRTEAAAAVADCRSAGIVPVMITGDHPDTARAIAQRLGLLDGDGEVLTGDQVAAMDDATFARHVRAVRVYARAAPEHKIRIIESLQRQGEFVAMTGDGVNDAPALKRANIGIAMGVTGTDVAKEAAHMVLLDDNFSTIVHAVREGRRIFDNIRKFVKYTMTSNAGEIWVIALAPLFGMPIPLLPIHILWINLVTDGLPGLALSAEREERDIMNRPPRPPSESLFAHGLGWHILWVGLLMGAMSLLMQKISMTRGDAHWQTMVFTVLTLSQLGHVLAIRSDRESLWSRGFWSNRPLALAVLFTVSLQLLVIYLPALNGLFHTAPLGIADLALCVALSSIVYVAVEAEKAWRRHTAPLS